TVICDRRVNEQHLKIGKESPYSATDSRPNGGFRHYDPAEGSRLPAGGKESMAAVKSLPPSLTIWWVDESDQTELGYEGTYGEGFADIDHPTAAEINAGLNISCALTTDITLGWTDRDTDDTRGLCDDSNVATPTA